jgi:hypothetical protein
MTRRSTRIEAQRPMRELLSDLRKLDSEGCGAIKTEAQGQLDRRVAENAATVMAVCHNGLAALGHLLAHSSPVIEDGTIGAESVEALGWLMAEIGDLAGACAVLAMDCRVQAATKSDGLNLRRSR